MYKPTFLCPKFFFPPIIPDSILSIRMANPSTLLSSHHFPRNFALWLPILSPASFTFSPPTGSFSHSHYCLLSKPTKHYPVTCSPSQPNFLKELSIHFVFTSPPSPSSSHSSTCSPNVGLLRVQTSVPSSLLSTVKKPINSTNRSCLSLTLLFLLIFSSIFSPCLQQRECVSVYVWWWGQERLRTLGEQSVAGKAGPICPPQPLAVLTQPISCGRRGRGLRAGRTGKRGR